MGGVCVWVVCVCVVSDGGEYMGVTMHCCVTSTTKTTLKWSTVHIQTLQLAPPYPDSTDTKLNERH